MSANTPHRCEVHKQSQKEKDLFPIPMLRNSIRDILFEKYPDCDPNGYICGEVLRELRAEKVEKLLTEDKGELSSLEKEVVRSFEEHDIISENLNKSYEKTLSFGERMADRLARFGGSWPFIISFLLVLGVWMFINTDRLLMKEPFDPYPYILLNLVLSCLAAIQAPIILMSQNREAAKDRMRSENEYVTNLKAELEIRLLHTKLDQLMKNQWDRLVEIQRIQIDLAEDLLETEKQAQKNNKKD